MLHGSDSSLGITSISLSTSIVDQNINGNLVQETATFTYANSTTGEIAEAFLDNDPLDSTYTGSYTLNPEVLLLPNMRG